MEAKLCQAYLPDVVCSRCKQSTAILRCCDCGPCNLLCGDCDREVHWLHPLHDREVWKDGFFQYIPPHITIDSETLSLVEQGVLCFAFILLFDSCLLLMQSRFCLLYCQPTVPSVEESTLSMLRKVAG
jgi:hypothetical protein